MAKNTKKSKPKAKKNQTKKYSMPKSSKKYKPVGFQG